MKIIRAILVATLVFSALGVSGADDRAPNVVVERHLRFRDRLTRITLFDNRMAVTTVREGDTQAFFRQITLPTDEYTVYVEVVRAVADTAGTEPIQRLDGDKIEAVVRLDLQGAASRSFSYSPVQVLDLDTSRLIKALDDLEQRVAQVSPSQEALSHWTPKVGDRLLLFSGSSAIVSEIEDDGLIRLEYEVTNIIELVSKANYHLVIMEVLQAPR